MFNKKMKIIVFGIIALFLAAILIFALNTKDKDATNNKAQSDVTEDEVVKRIIEELKNNHPEFSAEQLEFYRKIANSGEKEIFTCLGREDERNCIAAVAFIKSDKSLCYIHGHDYDGHNHEAYEEEYEESLKECINDILQTVAATEEISKCQLLDGDDFFNCLKNLFSIYNKQDDCANLSDKEARMICEEVFNYEEAYLKYDRELCAEIKNEKLSQYCLENIIDKFQDTDGDGLTDLDEINKYKTHYLFPDTDGDGFLDGDEVEHGYNPRE